MKIRGNRFWLGAGCGVAWSLTMYLGNGWRAWVCVPIALGLFLWNMVLEIHEKFDRRFPSQQQMDSHMEHVRGLTMNHVGRGSLPVVGDREP